MKNCRLVVIIMLVVLLAPRPAQAESRPAPARNPVGVSCGLPESDAEELFILAAYDGSYSWDHTNLTVAVQAHPSATVEQRAAIHGAIATWSSVIANCFDGLITLTDVTGTQPSEQKAADIVVRFVPNGLGLHAGGIAYCFPHDCPNIFIRSDYPPGIYGEYFSITPEELGWVTLHELGHALGLGHATNLKKSTDLMGYGWGSGYPYTQPVLSDCDVDAIAYAFAWALDGSQPYPPTETFYDCSLD